MQVLDCTFSFPSMRFKSRDEMLSFLAKMVAYGLKTQGVEREHADFSVATNDDPHDVENLREMARYAPGNNP